MGRHVSNRKNDQTRLNQRQLIHFCRRDNQGSEFLWQPHRRYQNRFQRYKKVFNCQEQNQRRRTVSPGGKDRRPTIPPRSRPNRPPRPRPNRPRRPPTWREKRRVWEERNWKLLQRRRHRKIYTRKPPKLTEDYIKRHLEISDPTILRLYISPLGRIKRCKYGRLFGWWRGQWKTRLSAKHHRKVAKLIKASRVACFLGFRVIRTPFAKPHFVQSGHLFSPPPKKRKTQRRKPII